MVSIETPPSTPPSLQRTSWTSANDTSFFPSLNHSALLLSLLKAPLVYTIGLYAAVYIYIYIPSSTLKYPFGAGRISFMSMFCLFFLFSFRFNGILATFYLTSLFPRRGPKQMIVQQFFTFGQSIKLNQFSSLNALAICFVFLLSYTVSVFVFCFWNENETVDMSTKTYPPFEWNTRKLTPFFLKKKTVWRWLAATWTVQTSTCASLHRVQPVNINISDINFILFGGLVSLPSIHLSKCWASWNTPPPQKIKTVPPFFFF